MSETKSALERAFEIARSGLVSSVWELRLLLITEGFAASQIDGPDLGRKLRLRIHQSRSSASAITD